MTDELFFNGFLLYKLRLYAFTSMSKDYYENSFRKTEVSARKSMIPAS